MTDARIGTTAVQRIYKNGNIVYNRHNWQQWSIGTATVVGDAELVAGSWLSSMRKGVLIPTTYLYGLFTSSPSGISLWMKCSEYYGGTYIKVETALENGYIYGSNTASVSIDSNIVKLEAADYEDGKPVITRRQYDVAAGQTTTREVKGSTYYGDVQGYAGDYPTNGKQGGYWYVKI